MILCHDIIVSLGVGECSQAPNLPNRSPVKPIKYIMVPLHIFAVCIVLTLAMLILLTGFALYRVWRAVAFCLPVIVQAVGKNLPSNGQRQCCAAFLRRRPLLTFFRWRRGSSSATTYLHVRYLHIFLFCSSSTVYWMLFFTLIYYISSLKSSALSRARNL